KATYRTSVEREYVPAIRDPADRPLVNIWSKDRKLRCVCGNASRWHLGEKGGRLAADATAVNGRDNLFEVRFRVSCNERLSDRRIHINIMTEAYIPYGSRTFLVPDPATTI
ncbi:hypothetical protein WG66_004473, partial [Moniliophthora roreri]